MQIPKLNGLATTLYRHMEHWHSIDLVDVMSESKVVTSSNCGWATFAIANGASAIADTILYNRRYEANCDLPGSGFLVGRGVL